MNNTPEVFKAHYYFGDDQRVEVLLRKDGDTWYIDQELQYCQKHSSSANFVCPICGQFLNDDDMCPGGHDRKARRYSKEDIFFFVEKYDWMIE